MEERAFVNPRFLLMVLLNLSLAFWALKLIQYFNFYPIELILSFDLLFSIFAILAIAVKLKFSEHISGNESYLLNKSFAIVILAFLLVLGLYVDSLMIHLSTFLVYVIYLRLDEFEAGKNLSLPQVKDLDFNLVTSIFILALSIFYYLSTAGGRIIFNFLGLNSVHKVFGDLGSSNLLMVILVVFLFWAVQFLLGKKDSIKGEDLRGYFNKIDIYAVSILAISLAARLPILDKIFHASPGSFYLPQVAGEMVEAISRGDLNALREFVSPGGRIYTRGSVYTLLLAASFSIFGINDYAARLPSVILGSLNVLLVYYLAKTLYGKYVGIFSAVLMAVSGWAIFFSSFIRHYILYVCVSLLVLLFYLLYIKTDKMKYLNWFLVSVSIFLLTHVQSVVPTAAIFGLIFLDFTSGKLPKNLLDKIPALLVGLYPLYIVLDTFNGSNIIIQFSGYHFGLKYWFLGYVLAMAGMLYSLKDYASSRIAAYFCMIAFVLPPLASLIGRDLTPRYTAILFPLFIMFLSNGLWSLLKEYVEEVDYRVFAFGIILLSTLVFANGFYFPLQDYTRVDVNTKDFDKGSFADRPRTYFKEPYLKFSQISYTNESTYLLVDDPWNAYWYTVMNQKTKNENIMPILLADKQRWSSYGIWTVAAEVDDYNFYRREIGDKFRRQEIHTGIPVIDSVNRLEQLTKERKTYAIFDEFKGRSGVLYDHVARNYEKISQYKRYEVYRLD